MAQKYVVAAIQTWEGRRINWSQIIQQKMHAEVMRVKVGVPRILELYSAFYISFFSAEMYLHLEYDVKHPRRPKR
jgi:hypothetical protein